MLIKVVEGTGEAKAKFCSQRFGAISTDGTPVGTTSMFNCTGLVLFPNGKGAVKSPGAVGHVEARNGTALYQRCIGTAIAQMIKQMKEQNGNRLALVLLGNAAAANAEKDVVAAENKSLSEIILGLGFADADVIDLRNGMTKPLGAGRAEKKPEGKFPNCVFHPKTQTLYLFSGMVRRPDDAEKGATEFEIQEPEKEEGKGKT